MRPVLESGAAMNKKKLAQQASENNCKLEDDQPGVVERAVRVWRQRESSDSTDSAIDKLATETAVALVYNGVSHAVMMASPMNLEEFALGFSLSEGIVNSAEDIYEIQVEYLEQGIEVLLTISSQCFINLKNKRRNLSGRTGCGLCGVESLQQIRLPVPAVELDFAISSLAVNRATKAFSDHQPLQALTGAVHGAAWCNIEGELLQVREDVGRHNALDKLIGFLCQEKLVNPPGLVGQAGFLLISSRASYEILQKSAMVNIGIVVAISAATSLAIDIANQAGITLIGFSRDNRHTAYTNSQRLLV